MKTKKCPKCRLEHMDIIDSATVGLIWFCPLCGYSRKIRSDKIRSDKINIINK